MTDNQCIAIMAAILLAGQIAASQPDESLGGEEDVKDAVTVAIAIFMKVPRG